MARPSGKKRPSRDEEMRPEPGTPTVAAAVREQANVSWSKARALCAEGRVTVNGDRWLDAAARLPADAVVVVSPHAPRAETGPVSRSAIVFADRDLVIVDKPSGILSVADEEGSKHTMVEYTRLLLRRMGGSSDAGGLGVVHRIDKDTSGLMVFTRTAEAKRKMTDLFRTHDIDRIYHAIAHGDVKEQVVETWLLPDRGDGLRGSHGHYRRAKANRPPDAKRAVTHVRPLAKLKGATLVECRLETGRQHQIRIHLAELGHPILGERVYIRDFAFQPMEAERTMLHARTLGFVHPRTGEKVAYAREAPQDFQQMVQSLS